MWSHSYAITFPKLCIKFHAYLIKTATGQSLNSSVIIAFTTRKVQQVQAQSIFRWRTFTTSFVKQQQHAQCMNSSKFTPPPHKCTTKWNRSNMRAVSNTWRQKRFGGYHHTILVLHTARNSTRLHTHDVYYGATNLPMAQSRRNQHLLSHFRS